MQGLHAGDRETAGLTAFSQRACKMLWVAARNVALAAGAAGGVEGFRVCENPMVTHKVAAAALLAVMWGCPTFYLPVWGPMVVVAEAERWARSIPHHGNRLPWSYYTKARNAARFV